MREEVIGFKVLGREVVEARILSFKGIGIKNLPCVTNTTQGYREQTR